MASSGIAAVLLPGGRTVHSRFKIPLKADQYSTAGINHGSDIAELLRNTSLIIWDEAPMQNRYDFESVDRCLRDIMASADNHNRQKPFGGITVVFGGDFRQILPVVEKGTRADIVNATINSSRLWNSCKVMELTQNMRLHCGNSTSDNKEIARFCDWVLSVGDGKLENVHPHELHLDPEVIIPDEYLVHYDSDPVQSIIDVTYPDLATNFSSHAYLKERAILTPTNAIVDDINNRLLDNLPGKCYTYLSADSIHDEPVDNEGYDSTFTVEYLNSINMSGLPKHELKLKTGTVVMLMRNLNQVVGLCNGTRMIVTKCNKNTIECETLCGTNVGIKHLIPRIDMQPSDSKWPFNFSRLQFPLQICFAMTINKSQGQSLETVGLYLPRPVFSHGQFYVAVSRVTSSKGLHILIVSDYGTSTNITSNIVYKEVFRGLPTVGS